MGRDSDADNSRSSDEIERCRMERLATVTKAICGRWWRIMAYIRKALRKLKPKCVICGSPTHYKKGYGWKCDSNKCKGGGDT